VLISEGGLHLLTTVREEKTGKIKVDEMHTTGIPVFFTTTTSVEPDQELLNRLMILSMDESETQTERILDFIVEDVSTPNPLSERKPDEEIIAFFEGSFNSSSLRADRVLIPYAANLKQIFAHKKVEARRDFRKLCRLIWSIAFLHQHQRVIVAKKELAESKLPSHRFIVALPADFYMAWAIADATMRQTLLGLQDRAIKALECFKSGKSLTARDVAAIVGCGQDHARSVLKVLEHRGYLLCDESAKPYQYSLAKTMKNDESNRISAVWDLLSRFGRKELDSWLDAIDACVCSPLPDLPLDPFQAFVDPITGQIWATANGEHTHEKHPLLTRKTLSDEKEPETSRTGQNRDDQRFLLWMVT